MVSKLVVFPVVMALSMASLRSALPSLQNQCRVTPVRAASASVKSAARGVSLSACGGLRSSALEVSRGSAGENECFSCKWSDGVIFLKEATAFRPKVAWLAIQ